MYNSKFWVSCENHRCAVIVLIYIKKYMLVFVPLSWHKAPKTLEISCEESNKVVFCCIVGTFGKPIDHLNMVAGHQRNHVIKGLELSVLLWGGERA